MAAFALCCKLDYGRNYTKVKPERPMAPLLPMRIVGPDQRDATEGLNVAYWDWLKMYRCGTVS